MSYLIRAMHDLEYLCRKADVVGQMRISISFDDPRDKALFEEEIKREMVEKNIKYTGFVGFPHEQRLFGETTICGIKVRIL